MGLLCFKEHCSQIQVYSLLLQEPTVVLQGSQETTQGIVTQETTQGTWQENYGHTTQQPLSETKYEWHGESKTNFVRVLFGLFLA